MRKSTVARIVLAVAMLLSTNMAVSTGYWSDSSTPVPDGPNGGPICDEYGVCRPPGALK